MLQYYYLNSIDSTNEYAKDLAREGSFDDCVIVADQQTHGRGSHGRNWYSDSDKGLYYTLLIKPSGCDFTNIQNLSASVAHQVIRTLLEVYQIQTDMKPPNDIMLNGKKLGGILIESAGSSSDPAPRYVIIGIGLNINQNEFPEALRSIAISIFQATGIKYDKTKLIAPLTKNLTSLFKG